MGRPYTTSIDYDDAMDMIGHNDKSPQLNIGEAMSQPSPFLLDKLPGAIQPHLAIHNLSKQTLAPVREHGDKIHARLSIIVSL